MTDFFSDLDNTLIYSHRHKPTTESVVVEYLNGRVQSFMTKKSFDFFKNCREVRLIPTTSRTYAQYERLYNTFSKFGCKYALLCNGGILLENGRIDAEWLDETRRTAGSELLSLREAEEKIYDMLPEQHIHTAENIMLYVKNDRPAEFASRLGKILEKSDLYIYCDSHKVYCFPKSINKGNAIKRFSRRFNISETVSAGDGPQDISMLNASDTAILTPETADFINGAKKVKVWDKKQAFADYICDTLSELLVTH